MPSANISEESKGNSINVHISTTQALWNLKLVKIAFYNLTADDVHFS